MHEGKHHIDIAASSDYPDKKYLGTDVQAITANKYIQPKRPIAIKIRLRYTMIYFW